METPPAPGGPQGFEAVAAEWLAWARTEGHDDYWRFRDAFFSIVPPPGTRTLEVGCGEGRVSRDLAARGHAVTAVDPSPTLLGAAAAAHPEGEYLLARAEGCRSPTPPSTWSWPTTCSWTSRTCLRRSPRRRACSSQAGGCASA